VEEEGRKNPGMLFITGVLFGILIILLIVRLLPTKNLSNLVGETLYDIEMANQLAQEQSKLSIEMYKIEMGKLLKLNSFTRMAYFTSGYHAGKKNTNLVTAIKQDSSLTDSFLEFGDRYVPDVVDKLRGTQ